MSETEGVGFVVKSQKGLKARRLLFGAAFSLIGEGGVKDLSVRDVCEYAGLKRTSFYNYFQSIDDLLDQLAKSEIEAFDQAFAKRNPRISRGAERLAKETLHLLKRVEQDKAWGNFIFRVLLQDRHSLDAAKRQVAIDIRAAVKEGTFVLSSDDIEPYNKLFMAGMVAPIRQLISSNDVDNLGERTVRMLLMAGGANAERVTALLKNSS
ncbi:MAG: TetR/AcrR family transcriptional regulator [Pseudomonadota bacterium]